MMDFTCCECERTVSGFEGDIDERMCHKCLDKEEEENE